MILWCCCSNTGINTRMFLIRVFYHLSRSRCRKTCFRRGKCICKVILSLLAWTEVAVWREEQVGLLLFMGAYGRRGERVTDRPRVHLYDVPETWAGISFGPCILLRSFLLPMYLLKNQVHSSNGNVQVKPFWLMLLYQQKPGTLCWWCFSRQRVEAYYTAVNFLRVVFIDLSIGTSVLTFIPVLPLLDH